MEQYNVIQTKAKRVRSNPTRKWLFDEEKALIEFLTQNRDFEKPTSQMDYRRFSKESNIAVDWKLTRAKVRYMRRTYNKAKAWEGSTGAGSMEGETMKATLLKMCTFFYEMEEIFGSRVVESAVINDSLENNENNSEVDLNESASSAAVCEGECIDKTIRKGIYSRTAASDILQFQSEMIQLKKQNMEQEMSFKEKELELRERELRIKEKEVELREKQELLLKDKEMEMKVKELESNEKLKIMEIQMKERLAMEELKYKYK
ncbi:uncharacterized protein LOC105219328 [Zeugodacus cucurbitae]|uniref:uncharacterized protein LOC105219328 n=1 Tax=Zeugodacus cucurbitae TaxID=28588 RepID=UPI0023D94BD8|nr:uncharacterized protein LOC105219328 [Zeugodacus cucurbitae]